VPDPSRTAESSSNLLNQEERSRLYNACSRENRPWSVRTEMSETSNTLMTRMGPRIEKRRRARVAIAPLLLGEDMLVEPERLDDLMSAKTVGELARRDSE